MDKQTLLFALLAAVAVSVAVIVLLALLAYRRKKRIRQLRADIAAFLNEGTPFPCSLREDSFAALENEVAELVRRCTLEKGNAQALILENNAFLADISHQIKTPLAGLRLYTEMAQQNPSGEQETIFARQIALIERMETLIYNLLRLEKLRSDGYEMHLSAHPLENICGEVIGELRTLYPEKKFSLQGTAELRCDRMWMHEAIENVVKNACEHTQQDGSVALCIEATDTAVFLRVEDDGGGVTAAQWEEMFERFTNSRAAAKEGTGLGLAITRAIVRRHHASVCAMPGKKGLRMEFCFPSEEKKLRTAVKL